MITIEAKRLSGIDRGKIITFTTDNPERHHNGKLTSVEHNGLYETTVKFTNNGRTYRATVAENHHIKIEGITE